MKGFQTINPSTSFPLSTYAFLNGEEIGESLQHSEEVYKSWRTREMDFKCDLLEKLAKLLTEQEETLAIEMTLEMGKPIKESRSELRKCAWLCRYYAQEGPRFLRPQRVGADLLFSTIRYDPIGAVLGIMPWNFPYWQVFRAAIPAIFAGNCFILKHAINVMGCAESIEELFLEAGFPDHLFMNLAIRHEDIGKLISTPHIAGVALTGSLKAGSIVAKLAGENIKPCVLELGGSDAFIVLEDCDIDGAVKAGVFSRMLNNGQSCIAAKRFLVQSSIYDSFLQKIVSEVSKIRVGDPLSETTQMGPMARSDLRDTLNTQVCRSVDEGATLEYVHPYDGQEGFFYPPRVMSNVTSAQPVFVEETFGPALAISRIDDLSEAIRLSNQSSFGLGATIWTDSHIDEATLASLDVGTIAINGFVKSDPRLPFGGTKQSGYGRELSQSGIRAFVNEKVISRFI